FAIRPIRLGTGDCCAHAASGHAIAAPPRSVMNSRRCIMVSQSAHRPFVKAYHTARQLRCLLWIISGHFSPSTVTTVLPPKPTFVDASGMSALGQKRANQSVTVPGTGIFREALARLGLTPIRNHQRR